jgi:predicted sulfurtransferase
MGKLTLFYKYVHIKYPKQILKWQTKMCQELGLKGRIILAHEGINATLAGTDEAIDCYIEQMNAHELFGGIDFKNNAGDANYFPRLRIVVKDEIVHLGIDSEKLTVAQGGKHLTPEQTHELIKSSGNDLVILDTRNNYESRIGTFTNAVIPDIKNFREFPDYIENNLEQFKDKKVLMFCTGGVRCERATAVLNVKGVAQEIYQIEGGIQRYTEQFPDGYFRGKNYVFDGRVAVRINEDVLSTCDLCPAPCDDYTNCLNASCNKHHISCAECRVKYNNSCSQKCMELLEQGKVAKRPPLHTIAPDSCSVK